MSDHRHKIFRFQCKNYPKRQLFAYARHLRPPWSGGALHICGDKCQSVTFYCWIDWWRSVGRSDLCLAVPVEATLRNIISRGRGCWQTNKSILSDIQRHKAVWIGFPGQGEVPTLQTVFREWGQSLRPAGGQETCSQSACMTIYGQNKIEIIKSWSVYLILMSKFYNLPPFWVPQASPPGTVCKFALER